MNGRIHVIKQIANGTLTLGAGGSSRIENKNEYTGLNASGKCITVQAWEGNYYIIGSYGL
jgi:hypothetical protein